ncbi:MAG: hypothetical protein ACFFBE_17410, partial [Promethearchaeota archaeon]
MNKSNIEQLLRKLRENKSSGASELIEDVLGIIAVQLDLLEDRNMDITEEIYILFKKIIDSRSTMAPLINCIGYLLQDVSIITKSNLENRIKQFKANEIKKKKVLENNFRKFLKEKEEKLRKIMLISYSSTVLNVLEKNKDFDLEIFVLESRPLLE